MGFVPGMPLTLSLYFFATILKNVVPSIPAWVPVKTTNTGQLAPIWEALPAALITGIVGLAFASILVPILLLSIAGWIRVTLDATTISIFTGLGTIGRTRRIPRAEIVAIKDTDQAITLTTNDPNDSPTFGNLLPTPRRRWLASALHAALFHTTPRRRS